MEITILNCDISMSIPLNCFNFVYRGTEKKRYEIRAFNWKSVASAPSPQFTLTHTNENGFEFVTKSKDSLKFKMSTATDQKKTDNKTKKKTAMNEDREKNNIPRALCTAIVIRIILHWNINRTVKWNLVKWIWIISHLLVSLSKQKISSRSHLYQINKLFMRWKKGKRNYLVLKISVDFAKRDVGCVPAKRTIESNSACEFFKSEPFDWIFDVSRRNVLSSILINKSHFLFWREPNFKMEF